MKVEGKWTVDDYQKCLKEVTLKVLNIVTALEEMAGKSYSDDQIEEMVLTLVCADKGVIQRNYAYLKKHGTLNAALLNELIEDPDVGDASICEKMCIAVIKVVRGIPVGKMLSRLPSRLKGENQ